MTEPERKPCPHCGRLKDDDGMWMHIKIKHRGKPYGYMRPISEPSEADLQVARDQKRKRHE